MCQICTLQANSKIDAKISQENTLGKVGRLRRTLIHQNNVLGKSHDLPENILKSEWQYVDNKKTESEAVLRNNLRKVFSNEVQLFLNRLKEKVGIKSFRKKPEITPLIVQTLLNWNEWFSRTEDAAREGINVSAREGFETALQRIDARGPSFSSEERVVRDVVNNIARQAAGTQSTFRRIAIEEIQRGLSAGDDMPDIVRRVANKTDEQLGHRLDRIVRTSAHGGFEVGQREAFRKSGMSRMRWLTMRDADVRAPVIGSRWNHRDADGQEVGVNETFVITGRGGISEALAFPGDPNGSPGNIIYCRCTINPVR